jgi:hypothetical protein
MIKKQNKSKVVVTKKCSNTSLKALANCELDIIEETETLQIINVNDKSSSLSETSI